MDFGNNTNATAQKQAKWEERTKRQPPHAPIRRVRLADQPLFHLRFRFSSPKRGLAPTLGAPICVVPPAHSSLKWMLLSACTPAALGRSRCRPHLMRHPKSDRLGMSHASSHSCQFWSKFGCSSVTDPPACLCPVVNLQRLHRKSGQKDKHFALCKLRFQFSNFASLKTPFFGHFLEPKISNTFPRISEIFPFLLRYSRPPLASFRF